MFVHLADHFQRAQAARFARAQEADFHAAFRQRHPRIDVRGIIVEINEDVLVLSPRQPGGDEAERERSRADEGDFVRQRVEQTGGERARMVHLLRRQQCFLVALCTKPGVVANRVGHPAGQRCDTGMGKKNLFARDGKFVLA